MVERRPVGKTLGIRYNIQKKRTCFSLLIALIITLVVNWNAVASLIPRKITAPLCLTLKDGEINFTENEIERLIEQRQYVPNYDAEIYVSFESEVVEIGSYVRWKIRVVDTGISKLQKPYFYALIVSPQGDVVSNFPEFGLTPLGEKMRSWRTEDYRDVYTDCLPVESDDTQYYVPRKTLIDGRGTYVYVKDGSLHWSKPSEVLYAFKIKDVSTLIGRWGIFIFVYEESYIDRFGKVLDSQNFVKYTLAEIDVRSKSPPTSEDVLNKYILTPIVFLVTFVTSYLGIYSQVEKYKETLKRIGNKIKEHWIFIVSIMIIIFIQLWLYFR